MRTKATNLTSKNIREFTPQDTIYISKMLRGYQTVYFCRFVKFERGVVTGEVIAAEPNPDLHRHMHGTYISGRIDKCYLWGKSADKSHMRWEHANWFNRAGFVG